jgi:predicted ATPase
MSSTNNWYVITGGPATGKTTLLAELEKLGHVVVPEAARTLIDQALAKKITVKELRSDEKHFQENVVRLKEKIESEHDTNVLTFFDRGIHDTLAYMRYYNFKVEKWIERLMKKTRYKKVFLLDPLPTFHNDYARTEDYDFTKRLHKILDNVYSDYGMKPIHVLIASPKIRAKFVLDQIKIEQRQ